MTDVFKVEKREKLGSAATRRLRQAGRVPAVLYGHGQQNEHLSIADREVKLMLRHHAKMVNLTGDVSDTVLISDMQWDPLGIEVLHLDLIRVNLKESVEVTVPIHLHGDAPGVREGGILLENEHQVDIRCPAGGIPEQLELDVNELHLGDQLVASNLVLPEGVELVTPGETVIVHVEAPRAEAEEPESPVGAEPELIERSDEDEEEGA